MPPYVIRILCPFAAKQFAGDRPPARQRFETTSLPAAADDVTVRIVVAVQVARYIADVHHNVADFASGIASAPIQTAVDKDPATNSGSNHDADHITETLGHPLPSLTKDPEVGVVLPDRQACRSAQ